MNTCDCLEKVREALVKNYGDSVCLGLKMWIVPSTGETGMDLPPLDFTYKVGSKRKKSHVKFLHCPFCGKAKST